MPKLEVIITERHTATFDSGDLPARLIKTLLEENNGYLSRETTGYSVGDIDRNERWEVESIEVNEVKPQSKTPTATKKQ